MRGYFDDEEPEAEQPRRDTELTLGAGALLGLFFALALLCGLCFGLGYAVGHRSSTRAAAATVPTAAPDQEPLQANNAIPKPSAADQTAPAAPADTTSEPSAPGEGTNPAPTQSSPAAGGQAAPSPAASQPVRSALPAAGNAPQTAPATQGAAAPNVHAALPNQTLFMVQIAAVLNPEDANVLVDALRKHGYSVSAAREPADGLIHVRIGPFTSYDEANRWRDKLLGDGYNAVVQP